MEIHRKRTKGVKRKKCYSVVIRKTDNLSDGSTITTETKDEKSITDHEEFALVQSISKEYQESLADRMQQTLTINMSSVIHKCRFLSERLTAVMGSYRQFVRWRANHRVATLGDIVYGAMYEDFWSDSYFLGHSDFTWNDCIQYANLLLCSKGFANTVRNPKQRHDFIHDFLVERLKDKLLMSTLTGHIGQYWPKCVSGIPTVVEVSYGSDTVRVLDGVQFAFLTSIPTASDLNGIILRPDHVFFPVDMMLLAPEYRKLYQLELEGLKKTLVSCMSQNPGVRFELSQRSAHIRH